MPRVLLEYGQLRTKGWRPPLPRTLVVSYVPSAVLAGLRLILAGLQL
jgi:hypothetical protein